MDKTIIFIIVIVILVGVGFWVWQSGIFTKTSVQPTPLPTEIVLFYGNGCSHCEDVENFISQNNIDAKLKITRLEVWYNKANQELLAQVAKQCGITGNSVGVPFLYDPPSDETGGNGKCYIGDPDVPNFLKTQAGLQ
jgi:hypothetical protein